MGSWLRPAKLEGPQCGPCCHNDGNGLRDTYTRCSMSIARPGGHITWAALSFGEGQRRTPCHQQFLICNLIGMHPTLVRLRVLNEVIHQLLLAKAYCGSIQSTRYRQTALAVDAGGVRSPTPSPCCWRNLCFAVLGLLRDCLCAPRLTSSTTSFRVAPRDLKRLRSTVACLSRALAWMASSRALAI